jgi:hypothetical protein
MLEQRANIQVPTNSPPDRRLDAILEQLQTLGPGAFEFAFYLNGVALTNQSVIRLGTNHSMTFQIKNLGKTTAEHLTLHFSPSPQMLGTNTIKLEGWKTRGHYESYINGQKVGLSPAVETISEVSIPPGGSFGASPVIVSEGPGVFVLTAGLLAFADRSGTHACNFTVIIEPQP